MIKVTIITHIVVTSLALALGIMSYWAYGNMTREIVLYNLPGDSIFAMMTSIFYMLNMVGSFAITIQPIYHIVDGSIQESEDNKNSLNFYFVAVRLGLPVFIVCVSTLFPDINILLSFLAGSICGTILLILPVVFYRKAYIERPSKKDRTWTMRFGYLLIATAIVIGIFGVV